MAGPTSSEDDWSEPSYRRYDASAGRSEPESGSSDSSGSESESGWSPARQSTARQSQRSSPEREAPPVRRAPRDRSSDRSGQAGTASGRRTGRAFDGRTPVRPEDRANDGGWNPAGPTSNREQRATRQAELRAQQDARRTERSVQALAQRKTPRPVAPYERGAPWWAALVVLVAITLAGALIDSVASIQGQNAFNIAIVIGAIVAILLVKRSQMFPIVVAPPIVYAIAAVLQLYLHKSLSQDKHGALDAILNAVQNYLIYGFPALASATAAVLIVAGIRMVLRRSRSQEFGDPVAARSHR